MMDIDDEYDELYDDDDTPINVNEFDLGPCITAPTAQLYTTKQLHSMCTRQHDLERKETGGD